MASSPPSHDSIDIKFKASPQTWRNLCAALVLIMAIVFGARFIFAGEFATVHTTPAE